MKKSELKQLIQEVLQETTIKTADDAVRFLKGHVDKIAAGRADVANSLNQIIKFAYNTGAASCNKGSVHEMFDPMDGAKHYPSTTKLEPQLQKKVETVANSLQKLHAALKKEVVARYGQRFEGVELYFSVDSAGNPEVQIHGDSNDPKINLGGGLDVRYPRGKFGR
jgi:hypothetical protein